MAIVHGVHHRCEPRSPRVRRITVSAHDEPNSPHSGQRDRRVGSMSEFGPVWGVENSVGVVLVSPPSGLSWRHTPTQVGMARDLD